MNVSALNKNTPADQLRQDHARVMSALVMAMKAAQNWHDIMQAAEAMVDVEICHFRPMLREAIHLMSDNGPMTAVSGKVAP